MSLVGAVVAEADPLHPSVLHQVLGALLAAAHGVAQLALLLVRAAGAVVLSRPGRLLIVTVLVLVVLRRVQLRARDRRAARRAAR